MTSAICKYVDHKCFQGAESTPKQQLDNNKTSHSKCGSNMGFELSKTWRPILKYRTVVFFLVETHDMHGV